MDLNAIPGRKEESETCQQFQGTNTIISCDIRWNLRLYWTFVIVVLREAVIDLFIHIADIGSVFVASLR
jgi:hypothetical protein